MTAKKTKKGIDEHQLCYQAGDRVSQNVEASGHIVRKCYLDSDGPKPFIDKLSAYNCLLLADRASPEVVSRLEALITVLKNSWDTFTRNDCKEKKTDVARFSMLQQKVIAGIEKFQSIDTITQPKIESQKTSTLINDVMQTCVDIMDKLCIPGYVPTLYFKKAFEKDTERLAEYEAAIAHVHNLILGDWAPRVFATYDEKGKITGCISRALTVPVELSKLKSYHKAIKIHHELLSAKYALSEKKENANSHKSKDTQSNKKEQDLVVIHHSLPKSTHRGALTLLRQLLKSIDTAFIEFDIDTDKVSEHSELIYALHEKIASATKSYHEALIKNSTSKITEEFSIKAQLPEKRQPYKSYNDYRSRFSVEALINAGVGKILITAYICNNDDLHCKNFGPFGTIDFDMCMYAITHLIKGKRLIDMLTRKDPIRAARVTRDDIDKHPCMTNYGAYYHGSSVPSWGTRLEHFFSNDGQKKRALSVHPRFIQQKWETCLRFLTIPPTTFQKIAEQYFSSKEDSSNFVIFFTKRQEQFKKLLMSLAGFKDYITHANLAKIQAALLKTNTLFTNDGSSNIAALKANEIKNRLRSLWCYAQQGELVTILRSLHHFSCDFKINYQARAGTMNTTISRELHEWGSSLLNDSIKFQSKACASQEDYHHYETNAKEVVSRINKMVAKLDKRKMPDVIPFLNSLSSSLNNTFYKMTTFRVKEKDMMTHPMQSTPKKSANKNQDPPCDIKSKKTNIPAKPVSKSKKVASQSRPSYASIQRDNSTATEAKKYRIKSMLSNTQLNDYIAESMLAWIKDPRRYLVFRNIVMNSLSLYCLGKKSANRLENSSRQRNQVATQTSHVVLVTSFLWSGIGSLMQKATEFKNEQFRTKIPRGKTWLTRLENEVLQEAKIDNKDVITEINQTTFQLHLDTLAVMLKRNNTYSEFNRQFVEALLGELLISESTGVTLKHLKKAPKMVDLFEHIHCPNQGNHCYNPRDADNINVIADKLREMLTLGLPGDDAKPVAHMSA